MDNAIKVYMNFIDRCVLFIAKVSGFCIHVFRLGEGLTWPGEIAVRMRPNILSSFDLSGVSVVVVAGTNGKTTTVKMLETILKVTGKKIKRNASGANLENGIISLFLSDSSFNGVLKSSLYLLEVDEGALPAVLQKIHPNAVILINLFRDQLDRYGEVDMIAAKWQDALVKLPKTTFVSANADDPNLVLLTSNLTAQVSYFGLEDATLYLGELEHATDTIYCPKCGQRLTFAGVYFSHLGKWACGKCGLVHPEVFLTSKDYHAPIEGIYNKYNILASASVSEYFGVKKDVIQKQLDTFIPAFGRMETVSYEGIQITILLSKNPTGFNESLRTVGRSEKQGPMLLVLNDRIPDGTDVSWIWDVDFEIIGKSMPKSQIVISGDRAYDLATRMQYASDEKNPILFDVIPDLKSAIKQIVSVTKSGEHTWILATYSAMLDVRKILTGRKIL
jgi:lipid II isoglutaminyl synthase (glutamine-hydrolysing)